MNMKKKDYLIYNFTVEIDDNAVTSLYILFNEMEFRIPIKDISKIIEKYKVE